MGSWSPSLELFMATFPPWTSTRTCPESCATDGEQLLLGMTAKSACPSSQSQRRWSKILVPSQRRNKTPLQDATWGFVVGSLKALCGARVKNRGHFVSDRLKSLGDEFFFLKTKSLGKSQSRKTFQEAEIAHLHESSPCVSAQSAGSS